jgi:hypothetical protein
MFTAASDFMIKLWRTNNGYEANWAIKLVAMKTSCDANRWSE